MKKIKYIFLLFCLYPFLMQTDGQNKAYGLDIEKNKVISTDRQDGRYISTRGVVHALMKRNVPAYAFHSDFSQREFNYWKEGLRGKMKDLMRHPNLRDLPTPKRVSCEKREGYRIEKWESYPLPECVVPF